MICQCTQRLGPHHPPPLLTFGPLGTTAARLDKGDHFDVWPLPHSDIGIKTRAATCMGHMIEKLTSFSW
jgi:hypothetical protein